MGNSHQTNTTIADDTRLVKVPLEKSEECMRIFLSGVSCVGKTTIGKQLAEEVEYKFFDLDSEVEAYYGNPIELLHKEFVTMDAYHKKAAVVLERIIASNPDNYVVALTPSGFRQVFWNKMQIVNPVTIVLTD
ncbi:hypothetical protein SBF1_1980006 [Candidatus Desulfosporosinus infrequens]|uniref:Shikimate kinase n=1 Tax=Candidatus Desulfosporosinus infrequens TaxID=2043169 RepID=A0A2U3KGN2_9FIRM|nr:hypothetical protein SBF1_1980006 [Candidatus Desulfosporosinus infrequens]